MRDHKHLCVDEEPAKDDLLDKYLVSKMFDKKETPPSMRLWLYSYGFTEELCRQCGIRYDDDGLYLPVNDEEGRVCIQRRNFTGKAKYETYKAVKGPLACTEAGGSVSYLESAKVIFIVEDILSMMKIIMAGGVATPLMTTSLSAAHKRLLAEHPNIQHVVVWLDSDTAGLMGARKVVTELNSLGVVVSDYTGRYYQWSQPKEVPIPDLKEIIKKAHEDVE